MWKAFFDELGAKVVISPPTTEETVAIGCSGIVGDVCLPVKVFCGHAFSLVGSCDYVFIPAVHTMRQKVHNCPKLIGLPDLVRAVVPECPPILDPDIDINKGNRHLYDAIYQLGSLFTCTRSKVDNAVGKAIEAHRAYGTQMMYHGLRPPQAIEKMFPQFGEVTVDNDFASSITIALIGRRYLLYDQRISYRLLHLLQKMGVNVAIAETVGRDQLRASMSELVDQPYWAYEEEFIGAGGHYLRSDVDGVISVVAFGCGPDSLMMELLQRRAKRLNRPFLNLVLDEHSAEGGLSTRLEAFVDMVQRAQRQPPRQIHIGRWHEQEQEQERIDVLGLPNMGAIAPAFRASAKILGASLLVPPITQRTISLGTRYSPEFACLPFKTILGSFIECLEMGADTLFMVTSSNACRMGYYSKVHEQILRDLGYKFKFLRHNSSDKGVTGVLRTVRRCTNHAPWHKVIAAYVLGTAKLRALDDLERKAAKVRAVELERGQTEHIYRAGVEAIDEATNVFALRRAVRLYLRKLDQVAQDPSVVPLRVGIVGELYIVLEPFVNLNVEVELGKLGVEVTRARTTYLSEWTSLKSYMGVLTKEKRKLAKYAYPYLRRDIGGHGLESVAEKVRLARAGYDGMLHLAPFTCMPESVAQSIMPTTEENLPVLTILCDEQITKTGMLTRLEAFVDLLERRRNNG